MKYLVYTLVHDGEGRFLLFNKHAMRYFFCGGENPVVFPDGQPIKGGVAYWTFPGGNFEGGDEAWGDDDVVITECQREFTEECGRNISFGVSGKLGAGKTTATYEGVLQRFNAGSNYAYAGWFVKVGRDDLDAIAEYLHMSLGEGTGAMQDIIAKQISTCAEIGDTYPNAPLDNELGFTQVFTHSEPDRRYLEQNLDKYPTDWFYGMILFMWGNLI